MTEDTPLKRKPVVRLTLKDFDLCPIWDTEEGGCGAWVTPIMDRLDLDGTEKKPYVRFRGQHADGTVVHGIANAQVNPPCLYDPVFAEGDEWMTYMVDPRIPLKDLQPGGKPIEHTFPIMLTSEVRLRATGKPICSAFSFSDAYAPPPCPDASPTECMDKDLLRDQTQQRPTFSETTIPNNTLQEASPQDNSTPRRLPMLYGIIMPNGEVVGGEANTYPQNLVQKYRRSSTDRERFCFLKELARFYGEVAPTRSGEQNWLELANAIEDIANRTFALMVTGAHLEKCRNWAKAAEVYRQAIQLEPTDPTTWYWANNNLGFSLNQLGDYTGGEEYCRRALKIDPSRPNAYKNLGLSLQGQGQLVEAAKHFIEGTLTCPGDDRSLRHLLELVEAHPDIKAELPTIEWDIAQCQDAVNRAKG